jgi:hypothetical protein
MRIFDVLEHPPLLIGDIRVFRPEKSLVRSITVGMRGRIKKEKMGNTSLDATVILLTRLFSGLKTLIYFPSFPF